MALFDLPLDALREYRPERTEQPDFDHFWSETLRGARVHDLDPTFELVDSGLSSVRTYDVTFSGWNGERIKAWLLIPVHVPGPMPCVVEYQGYGGGRGLPYQHLLYCAAGYATFVTDSRGQPYSDTGDPRPSASGPRASGFLTDGADNPSHHYYRRLMTDCVRAVETARAYPDVDASRVVVCGTSQGGGLALATAALVGDVAGLISDLPFLCHFRRAAELCDTDPYHEITALLSVKPYMTDDLFRALSYFDGMNFAARATAPALFSVAMMDTVCPPSTVYAAYNHYGGEKDLVVWGFNVHQVVPNQAGNHLTFLRRVVGSP
ncbi:MAG: acetylxylan esterase [Jatrophihabitans sp.]|uniref:acetylxylan esterase n=1 Tax=Jatrophihabitans sp. TaxID=1932789 RepID=UPI003F81268A